MNGHRGSCRVFCALFVSCFAPMTGVLAEITCEGAYEGHLQGIALEPGKAIYWSFTKALVKTDLEGRRLAHAAVPSHHGDPAWHDGKVYVAVNLGLFNEEPGKADSWVYVYSADNLALFARHTVAEAVHGAGGIAWHEGRFFIVGGLPKGYKENYVYEYDGDFVFIKRHILNSGYTFLGIQTVCRWQNGWWFGCYGEPKILIKADDDFHVLGIFREDWSIGIEGFSDTRCLKGATGKADGKGLYWGKLTLDTPGKQSNRIAGSEHQPSQNLVAP